MRNTQSYQWFVAILCLLVLWLVGCGENEVLPSPNPPLPTRITPVTLTTATSPALPPTSTNLPAPPTLAASPTLLATSSPMPSTTPSPTPLILNSPEDFGDARNPLTGEEVADTAVLQRRPLAIKVSNNPPEYTRPQNGLSQADLVFEHITEKNITRFTAVYYSQTPPDIGPIRSARLIDMELAAMYDAALVMSGTHPVVSQRLHRSDIGDRILRSHEPGFYRTGEDKPHEHTLHADPVGLWQAVEAHEQNQPPTFTSWMSFSSQPPLDGIPAEHVEIPYADWSLVEWEYEAGNGRYWRWTDSESLTDANNGEQISAANIVIVFVPHVIDKSICTYHANGICSDWPVQIQLWGEGEAIILRDGQQYPATWIRHNRSDMLTFLNEAGNPIPLQIGNTWFQVVPDYYTDDVIVEE